VENKKLTLFQAGKKLIFIVWCRSSGIVGPELGGGGDFFQKPESEPMTDEGKLVIQ
jgi:hypothetical protein